MADNLRWFKVWTTLLLDSIEIPLEQIGLFTLLGCLIAQKGDNGNLTVSKDVFKALMKYDYDKLPDTFCSNFNIKIALNSNGTFTVSLKNWHKYQMDSTGYERLKRWRMKRQGVTLHDNGDKIREDKTKIREDMCEISQDSILSFESFWKVYPKKQSKKKALEIWKKLNPNTELIKKILIHIEQAKISIEWTKDNGQFIPHPSTYLNQARWEDELTIVKDWRDNAGT